MKLPRIPLLLATLLAALVLRAADAPAGELVPPTDKDAAWLAQARDAYPLKTCLVSDEELGGMGKPVEMIYRTNGEPDRLVRFCCKMCVPKFKKEPGKYLARLASPTPEGGKERTEPRH